MRAMYKYMISLILSIITQNSNVIGDFTCMNSCTIPDENVNDGAYCDCPYCEDEDYCVCPEEGCYRMFTPPYYCVPRLGDCEQFECNDGCTVNIYYENDGFYCDCPECEDEDSCSCPNDEYGCWDQCGTWYYVPGECTNSRISSNSNSDANSKRDTSTHQVYDANGLVDTSTVDIDTNSDDNDSNNNSNGLEWWVYIIIAFVCILIVSLIIYCMNKLCPIVTKDTNSDEKKQNLLNETETETQTQIRMLTEMTTI